MYLPVELNLDNLLQENPISLSENNTDLIKIKDILAYYVGLVTRNKANKDSTDNSVWVGLYSKYLQNVIRNYKEFIYYLLENDILVCSDTYCTWEHKAYTKEYRLGDSFLGTQFKAYYIYHRTLIKRIDKLTSNNFTTQKYKRQYEVFEHLSIDNVEALKLLKSRYGNNEHQINNQLELIHSINKGTRRKFSQAESGRLFTPITRLTKEVRKTILKYKGQHLHEIDGKCCIPTLTLSLFDNELIRRNSSIQQKLRISNPIIFDNSYLLARTKREMKYSSGNKTITYTSTNTIINDSELISLDTFNMLCETTDLTQKYEDIGQYKDIVLKQDIYIHLKKIWNKALDKKIYQRLSKR